MTHPIVEAGARAAWEEGSERVSWDDAGILMGRVYRDKASAAILAALRVMRDVSSSQSSMHFASLWSSERLNMWHAGIDALIEEIEAQ